MAVTVDGLAVALDPRARALRPVRADRRRDRLTVYTATTFPGDPWGGCAFYLRRCAACEFLTGDGDADLILDVLDEAGDIVQDFALTREGFALLRRALGFRVAR